MKQDNEEKRSLRAAIISLGSKSSEMLAEAMKNHFKEVDMIDLRNIEVNLSKQLEVLYNGEVLLKYDCIYIKGPYKYAQLLNSLASSLWDKAYLPILPKAYISAHDKIYTQIDIQQNNIPMPTTYLTATIAAARKILKKVNYPIIMKFPQGTQGKGVMYADSFASASSILDALDTLKQPFLIQEYIETSGVDIRAIVVGEKVVAGMKRTAEIGEKRANIHAGGMGDAFMPDAHTRKVAVKAAKAIGAEVCAVDILEDVKGPTVIEINISPGLQGITETTEIDVSDKIAKFLHDKAKEHRQKKTKNEAKEIMKDINMAEGQGIITQLDLRGNRILLPELVTKISGLDENQEVVLSLKKGQVTIKKF
ncbi:RimK family alpha-L-glutamate ligase [Candidatus Woesearchaeota archaeon]|nr:RimK family alpha-L-glutamate ligase [Candidatus Woesearchaeota archaeon]